jgi:arabinose-5-phosphate isomerase
LLFTTQEALCKKVTAKDMLEHTLKPMVSIDAPIKSYFEISEKRLGVTAVVENDKVVIITDGDIRRMLNDEKHLLI